MKDEKKVFERQNVACLFVPVWEEMGIKRVWPEAARITEFLMYFPDGWTATHKTERKFFYGILSTLAPNFVQAMVNEARQLRHNHRISRQMPVRQMNISSQWADLLLREPFVSCK